MPPFLPMVIVANLLHLILGWPLLVGVVIVALVVQDFFSNKRREQICRFRYRDSSDRRDDRRCSLVLRADGSILLLHRPRDR